MPFKHLFELGLVNKYHQENIDIEQLWDFMEVNENEFPEITEWVLIEVGGNIHHVKANSKIYNLLKPFYDKDKVEITFVDSIKNIPVGRALEYDIERFYEGFLLLEISKVSKSLFVFAKESIKNPPRYLGGIWNLKKYFIDKLAEEELMLKKEQKDAIRNIAESIAKSFSQEVGILTKFAYSTEPKDFKHALEEALFKSAKISAMDGKTQYYNKESLSFLFDLLDDEEVNFKDLKNYFICFMSANVITANYKKEN